MQNVEKLRGFLNYQRNPEPYRPPLERLNDWEEINPVSERDVDVAHTALERKVQAARCMDCGTPFCQTHSGMYACKSIRLVLLIDNAALIYIVVLIFILSLSFSFFPLSSDCFNIKIKCIGCPVNNLIPEWNNLVFQNQWDEAIERLHKTNNFPEFTGRVCPAPCEGSCVAGLIDSPVTIKNIEYSIVDRAFRDGKITPRIPQERSGMTVAVVGSGPAGLACADQLNQMGHKVSVFERSDRVGGLLMYGIPNMKLEKETVDRRVNLLREEGIEFITNADIGNNVDVNELKANFDSLCLTLGSTKPRDLPVSGRDLKGVHFAMVRFFLKLFYLNIMHIIVLRSAVFLFFSPCFSYFKSINRPIGVSYCKSKEIVDDKRREP